MRVAVVGETLVYNQAFPGPVARQTPRADEGIVAPLVSRTVRARAPGVKWPPRMPHWWPWWYPPVAVWSPRPGTGETHRLPRRGALLGVSRRPSRSTPPQGELHRRGQAGPARAAPRPASPGAATAGRGGAEQPGQAIPLPFPQEERRHPRAWFPVAAGPGPCPPLEQAPELGLGRPTLGEVAQGEPPGRRVHVRRQGYEAIRDRIRRRWKPTPSHSQKP